MSIINNHIVHIHPRPEDETDFPSCTDVPVRDGQATKNLVTLVRSYRMRQTRIGKDAIAKLLFREHGMRVSPCHIGRIIADECLYFADTPLHWKKRLLCGKNGKCVRIPGSEKQVSVHKPAQTSAMQSFVQMRTEKPTDVHHASLLRRIGIASVITNLAIVGMLAGVLFLEYASNDLRQNNPVQQALQQADLPLHGAPSDSVVSH